MSATAFWHERLSYGRFQRFSSIFDLVAKMAATTAWLSFRGKS
jgi:hypothetical protein